MDEDRGDLMSKSVDWSGWNELSNVVQTDDGKMYVVDSCRTFDSGFETMVFRWSKKKHGAENMRELYYEHHTDEVVMAERHEYICNNLEELLRR